MAQEASEVGCRIPSFSAPSAIRMLRGHARAVQPKDIRLW
jgi:hypothetical protein